MSSKIALQEIARFLSRDDAEVLSVSGRWGVGKTHGWRQALAEAKRSGRLPRERYAYVSAFGIESLASLKASIFQATVKVDAPSLEPTMETFRELIRSPDNLLSLAEQGGRKGIKVIDSLVSMIPWVGRASDIIIPSTSLLIRNQLICIDDVERAGKGINLSDILGFVSSLQEEKNCKVVLLLNEEGLGEDQETFRKYLEKVVDQAVKYMPTPAESAERALDSHNPVEGMLAESTQKLGITNIRVIRRIRRFLSFVEPEIRDLHANVLKQTVDGLALLGWCVFEPTLAPSVSYVQSHTIYANFLREGEPTAEEAEWNALLEGYGFSHFDGYDAVLLDGLQSGGFDFDSIRREAGKLHEECEDSEKQKIKRRAWDILGSGFGNNELEFKTALIDAIEKYGTGMGFSEADSIITSLREIGCDDEAGRLTELYINQNDHQPREFFEIEQHRLEKTPDAQLAKAIGEKIKNIPVDRDAKELLLQIDKDRSWDPKDTEFLASLSHEYYVDLLLSLKDEDLHSVVRTGLMFNRLTGADPNQVAIGMKLTSALKEIGQMSRLNAMRVRPYLPRETGSAPADGDGS